MAICSDNLIMILTQDPMAIQIMQEKEFKAVARVLQRQDRYHKVNQVEIVSLRCLLIEAETQMEPLLIIMLSKIN